MATRETPLSRRFTLILVSERTGQGRRVSVSARVLLGAVLVLLLGFPVLVAVTARSSASGEIARLRGETHTLEAENASYRAATGELTTQIESLQTLTTDIGTRVKTDAGNARALDRLTRLAHPAAAGGPEFVPTSTSAALSAALRSPEDTFGIIRDVLGVLEDRLRQFQGDVARRQSMLAATPSIWPAYGWLSDGYGKRKDPFSGETDFHQGLDISTEKGRPVYATADGIVESASYSGAYGNLVAINHGLGVVTRYGHLSKMAVRSGESVHRGEVVGYVGSTGRATGSHLHYEVLLNGRFLNPLQLLTEPRR